MRRLSEGEERAFFHEYARTGSLSARNAIIETHGWLVAFVGRDYRCSDADRADLYGEGHLGLFEAFERFDTAHGVRFATYARYWVQASMSAYLKRSSSALGSLSHARTQPGRAISLDAPLSSEGAETLLDRLPSKPTDIDAVLEHGRLAGVVDAMLTTFDARERVIFEARFRQDEVRIEDVARSLQLSRGRVRQLEERVRTKLASGLSAFLA